MSLVQGILYFLIVTSWGKLSKSLEIFKNNFSFHLKQLLFFSLRKLKQCSASHFCSFCCAQASALILSWLVFVQVNVAAEPGEGAQTLPLLGNAFRGNLDYFQRKITKLKRRHCGILFLYSFSSQVFE